MKAPDVSHDLYTQVNIPWNKTEIKLSSLCLESVSRDIFLLDISINLNCFEMMDIALEFRFSVYVLH